MVKAYDRRAPAAPRDKSFCDGGDPAGVPEAFLAVVGSVNESALKTWTELWEEFKPHVMPAGLVHPQMQKGFKPSCGWAEFLEKLWVLKHYLDFTRRLCDETRGGSSSGRKDGPASYECRHGQ